MRARRPFVVLAASLAVVGGCRQSTGPDRDAVEAYAAAIRSPAREGGRLVVEEIRPSVTDLRAGRLSPDDFERFTTGWSASFDRVRAAFRTAPAPGKDLARVAQLYDRALAQYLDAVRDLGAAARQPEGDRLAAVDAAIATAEAADRAYDRAGAALARVRERAGVPASDVP